MSFFGFIDVISWVTRAPVDIKKGYPWGMLQVAMKITTMEGLFCRSLETSFGDALVPVNNVE